MGDSVAVMLFIPLSTPFPEVLPPPSFPYLSETREVVDSSSGGFYAVAIFYEISACPSCHNGRTSAAVAFILSRNTHLSPLHSSTPPLVPLSPKQQGECVHDLVNAQNVGAAADSSTSPLASLTEGIGATCNDAATSTSTYSSGSSSSNKHHHHHGARNLMTRRGGHGGHYAGAADAGGGSLTTLGMSLPFFKIFLQLLLTGLNVACWLVPMKIKKFRENQELISLANAFSGGVFLSLAFGHMIPHSLEGFEAAGYAHNVPFFVVLTGYLMIFFIEKIAFDTHALIDHHGHTHGDDAAAAPTAAPAPVHAVTNGARSNGGKMILTAHGGHGGKVPVTAAATTVTSIITPPSSPAPQASGRSAVILLLALAVHSIFETMALGLSDTPLSAGLLALSIALHQPAESIALLVAFLKSGLSEGQTTRYLSLFSTVGMIGVVLGLAVSSWASAVWDSIFVALTAGTFLYVGCTEIVAEEFEEEQGKWKKFGALLAGVVIVGAITTVTEGWEH